MQKRHRSKITTPFCYSLRLFSGEARVLRSDDNDELRNLRGWKFDPVVSTNAFFPIFRNPKLGGGLSCVKFGAGGGSWPWRINGGMRISMRDRSKNRKPLQRGRNLSIEAIQAVQALKRAKRYDELLQRAIDSRFRRLLKFDMVFWYKPHVLLLADIIAVFATNELFDQVQFLHSCLKVDSHRIEPGIEEFNFLLRALVGYKINVLAVDCFYLMKELGCEPDRSSFRILINGLEVDGETDESAVLRREAKKYYGESLEFLKDEEEPVWVSGCNLDDHYYSMVRSSYSSFSYCFAKSTFLVACVGRVCVTGASGFLASWLIKRLLQSDYEVVGTVRDPANEKKLAHLWKLDGAKERLKLMRAELTEEGSFDEAVVGCVGVFHTASPVFGNVSDPMPGSIPDRDNPSLRRVVLTSSSSALHARVDFVPNVPLDESSWSSVDLCQRFQIWYALSKTLAERAAWEFCSQNGIDLVTVLPSFIVGPSLPPELCSTASE
ncbi:unnamed protein product [Rhodiola kirilowii]